MAMRIQVSPPGAVAAIRQKTAPGPLQVRPACSSSAVIDSPSLARLYQSATRQAHIPWCLGAKHRLMIGGSFGPVRHLLNLLNDAQYSRATPRFDDQSGSG
jgi:hypothetical protein